MATFATSLKKHLKDGGAFRDTWEELYAGKCGGEVKRSNGSTSGLMQYCARAAGWGTDHSRVGYCRHHEDQLGGTSALPPWTGELDDDTWRELTGGKDRQPSKKVGLAVQAKVDARWEMFLAEALTEEEYHVFKSMPTDPVSVLDTEIRLNRLQAMRIHREIKRLNMAAEMDPQHVGGGAVSLEVKSNRATLIHISNALARLMEVRARLSELASSEAQGEAWMGFLESMDDDEFRHLSANPMKFMALMNQGHQA